MSSGLTRQYDPALVVLNYADQDFSGFAKGSMIEAEREVDSASKDVGTDGEVTLIISQNRSGTVKVILQQSSPLNDFLSSMVALLENTNPAGIKSLLLKDLNGTTIISCDKAWVKKPAKVGYSDTGETREWIIETGYLSFTVGGQLSL